MSARSFRRRRSSSRLVAPLRQPLSVAITAVLASSVAAPTLAQSQDTETIIVTATRRELSVQDIPLNIAAFDSALLEAREIDDLAELGRNVPGLYVIDQGKRSANNIVVRGLNLNAFQSAEFLGNNGGKTVATYLGEVPLYVDLSLNDLERVEVLLGPQGTLYGASTLGGAIRYIPRKPQFEDMSVTAHGGAFSLSESDGMGWRGGAVFNVPVGENFAFRASIDRYDDPGFIDAPYLVRQAGVSDPEPDFTNAADVAANLYRDNDVNWEETTSARIGLRWQLADVVDATLSYHYQQMDVGGRSQNHAAAFGTSLYESATRFPEPNQRTNSLLSAEIVADLDFAQLTLSSGLSNYDDIGQRDQTDLLITLQYAYEEFPSFSAFTREIEEEETFSQEIRLVSQSDGKWNWIAGLFFMDFDQPGAESREFTPGWDVYAGGLRPDNLEYINVIREDLTQRAVYGEFSYDVTDRWQLTFGARNYFYDFTAASANDLPLADTVFGGSPPDQIELDFGDPAIQDEEGTLFKFNTSYRFSDDVMGYFTISEGYRIGSSNGLPLCVATGGQQNVCAQPEELEFRPDTTQNYEIGLRSQWLDGRLTLNGALYYIDWQDPQLASATAVGAEPITINGAGAESKGLELSIDAQPTDRLRIGLSYAHMTAELTEVAPRLVRDFSTLSFGTDPVQYIDGQPGDRLPGSPEDQATLYFGYDWTLSSRWDLTLNYGVSAIGDIITTTGLRGGGETLGGFSVHHASAVFGGGPWEFAIYAQNLLDKYAVTGIRSRRDMIQTELDDGGNPVRVRHYAQQMLRPREIGFRFTYDLGRDN